MLHDQLPWYVAGPVLGLCVVALRLLLNGRLGVTGGYSALVERKLDWRAWFLFGLVAGAVVFGLVAGPTFDGYGWLTDTFTGDWRWVVAPILFTAGLMIGFGAKTAGGCTSGNGLSGSALGSPAAFAAFATFMATAVGLSLAIEAVL